jgi:hypothetical protein
MTDEWPRFTSEVGVLGFQMWSMKISQRKIVEVTWRWRGEDICHSSTWLWKLFEATRDNQLHGSTIIVDLGSTAQIHFGIWGFGSWKVEHENLPKENIWVTWRRNDVVIWCHMTSLLLMCHGKKVDTCHMEMGECHNPITWNECHVSWLMSSMCLYWWAIQIYFKDDSWPIQKPLRDFAFRVSSLRQFVNVEHENIPKENIRSD